MLENYCFCEIYGTAFEMVGITRFLQNIQVASMGLSNISCPSYFNHGKGKGLAASYIHLLAHEILFT